MGFTAILAAALAVATVGFEARETPPALAASCGRRGEKDRALHRGRELTHLSLTGMISTVICTASPRP
jgi:hypothetical protein